MPKPSSGSSLLKEPFIHFLILGGLLFAGDFLYSKWVERQDYIIRVNPDEIARQVEIFSGENGRVATDADKEALLFAYIEEQVLMREAERLGLDEDDTIIRRRLAQKMRFLIKDNAVTDVPDTDTLRAYYTENPDRFRRPERRAFSQIYLSPQARGATVIADAETKLAELQSGAEVRGDPFMLGNRVALSSATDLKKDYGTSFVKELFALPVTDGWQGPVRSVFGVHLVQFFDTEPSTLPDFESIRPQVEAVWLDQIRRQKNDEALADLIKKYKVEVE